MTSSQLLLPRVRYCSNFLCRLRGLTFRRSLADGEGLLLVGERESRAGAAIHMAFVFFPIAVIWLDEARRAVDVRLARPFYPLYVPARPAKDVLEGPPGLVEQVRVGDQLKYDQTADG